MQGPARVIISDAQTGRSPNIGIGSWGVANLHHSLRTWTLPPKLGTRSGCRPQSICNQPATQEKRVTQGRHATKY